MRYVLMIVCIFILVLFQKVCSVVENSDVGIIIDDSVSVFDEDFNKEKEFIYRIYDKIEPEKNNNRISVAKFSTAATMIVRFSEPETNDLKIARKPIECAQQTKGGTCINTVLELASNEMFGKNNTKDSAKILILITDGSCNCAGCADMVPISNRMKENNVKIVTIGVGYGVDEDELRNIASEPSYFLPVKSFDDLLDVLSNIFDLFETFSTENKKTIGSKKEGQQSSNREKESEKIIINNDEFLKNTKVNKSKGESDYGCNDIQKSIPYMNPIIVNIQTCPNTRVQQVDCKPGQSRCFQIEKNFLMDPADLQQELCKCSELALTNNLNFFKLDEKGTCSIGTSNGEQCSNKRSMLSKKRCTKKSHAIYKTDRL